MKLTCDVCASLKNKNGLLNEKAIDLPKIVHNFTNEKKTFDLMLGGKKCVFDKKYCIQNKPFLIIKYLKTYFVKDSSSNNSKFVCNYCNQNGHTSFSCLVKKNANFSVKQVWVSKYQKRHTSLLCLIKKNAYFGVKQVWMPKDPKTNSQGPKVLWIPKVNV